MRTSSIPRTCVVVAAAAIFKPHVVTWQQQEEPGPLISHPHLLNDFQGSKRPCLKNWELRCNKEKYLS